MDARFSSMREDNPDFDNGLQSGRYGRPQTNEQKYSDRNPDELRCVKPQMRQSAEFKAAVNYQGNGCRQAQHAKPSPWPSPGKHGKQSLHDFTWTHRARPLD
jgi:hypothetical protein